MEKLASFYVAPGYSTEYMHLYLATDLIPSRLLAEDSESITVVRVSLERAIGLIMSGEICDGKSVAGLLLYLAMKMPRSHSNQACQ